jgi:hypothetical protein
VAQALAITVAGAQSAARAPGAPPRSDPPAAVHTSTTVDPVAAIAAVSAPVLERGGRIARPRELRLLVSVASHANVPYALEVRRRGVAGGVAVRTAAGTYVPLDTLHWVVVARGRAGARNEDVVHVRLTGRPASRAMPVVAPLVYRVVARTPR